MEFTRRIYEGGKLTIPKELRELKDIREGDYVRIAILEVHRAPRDGGPTEGDA